MDPETGTSSEGDSFEHFSQSIDVGAGLPMEDFSKEKMRKEGEAKESESVWDAEKLKTQETVAGLAEDTEKKDRKEIFYNFVDEKLKIESNLSKKNLSEEEKNNFLALKRAVSDSIIKQGCGILGIEQEEVEKRIAEKQEKEWERAVEEFKLKNKVDYGEYQRRQFVKKDLQKKYEEQIKKNNTNFSDEQKSALLDPNKGEVRVGGWRGIILGKEDVAVCSYFGWEVDKIKFDTFLGLPGKVTIPGREGMKQFENLEQFNDFVAFCKERFINEGAAERMAQKKQEIINGPIKQFILDREVQKMYLSVREKDEEGKEAGKEAAEKAGKGSEAEKKEKVKQAAILWEKTYEIDRALRRKRKSFDSFKYKKISKGGEEKIFEGENAKKQAKKDKNKMSKELVRLANEILGEKKAIMKRAKNKFGETVKKRDYERFITEQVMSVLEGEGIKFIKTRKEKIKKD